MYDKKAESLGRPINVYETIDGFELSPPMTNNSKTSKKPKKKGYAKDVSNKQTKSGVKETTNGKTGKKTYPCPDDQVQEGDFSHNLLMALADTAEIHGKMNGFQSSHSSTKKEQTSVYV